MREVLIIRYILNATQIQMYSVSTEQLTQNSSTVTPYYPKASRSAGQLAFILLGNLQMELQLIYYWVNGSPIGNPAALTGNLQNKILQIIFHKG